MIGETDNDLTVQHAGEPIGERIIVSGRVFDTEGKPLRGTLVEIWQANSAGRYKHRWDRWPAPLDPNFSGAGRCVTDDEGRYQFTTIRPGPYPWGNHYNAWRPAHIHFSLLGRAFTQRLVTQMYFPGDPFFPYDPIFNSVRDREARRADDLELLDPRDRAELGPGVRVGHLPPRTRGDAVRGGALIFETTPSQTVGPYFAIGLPFDVGPFAVPDGTPGAIHISGTIYDGAGMPIPDFLLETWQADPDGQFADMYEYGGASELDGLPRLRPLRGRGRRRDVRHPDREAGRGARPRRRDAGAPHRRVGVRPRHAPPRASPGSTSPTRPRPTPATRCWRASRSSAARRCSRSRTTAATGSTSASRARTRPSSSRSEPRRLGKKPRLFGGFLPTRLAPPRGEVAFDRGGARKRSPSRRAQRLEREREVAVAQLPASLGAGQLDEADHLEDSTTSAGLTSPRRAPAS